MHPRFDGPCTLHPEATEIALYVLLTLFVCYVLFSAFPLLMSCQGAKDRREAKKASTRMAYELEREEGAEVELKSFKPSARFFVETVTTEKSVLKETPIDAPAGNKEETASTSIIVEGEVELNAGASTADAKGVSGVVKDI